MCVCVLFMMAGILNNIPYVKFLLNNTVESYRQPQKAKLGQAAPASRD